MQWCSGLGEECSDWWTLHQDTGTGSQGFTAQAFKQAFDSVGSYPRGVTIPDDADDYWYLDDTVLIPNLVKAIQEQQEQIEILQNEVEQLKGEK